MFPTLQWLLLLEFTDFKQNQNADVFILNNKNMF